MPTESTLPIGYFATLACLLEASAPKPGNVHPGARFADMSYQDFVAAAVALGPAMDQARTRGVGATVLAAVTASLAWTRVNTNLGTILLLAPMAMVADGEPLRTATARVLATLTAADSAAVYDAIQLAAPGGLGEVDQMDIRATPPVDLAAAMRAAADRDLVARQYVTRFETVFDEVVPWLTDAARHTRSLSPAIVDTHVRIIAKHGDSLIERKCGVAASDKARAMARQVLESGKPSSREYQSALADLDRWLRADGHRRNPGTAADLIAAGLFAALRERRLQPPLP